MHCKMSPWECINNYFSTIVMFGVDGVLYKNMFIYIVYLCIYLYAYPLLYTYI